jgi:hypothetical protein
MVVKAPAAGVGRVYQALAPPLLRTGSGMLTAPGDIVGVDSAPTFHQPPLVVICLAGADPVDGALLGHAPPVRFAVAQPRRR